MAISHNLLDCAALGGAIVFLAISGVGCSQQIPQSKGLRVEDQGRPGVGPPEFNVDSPEDLRMALRWASLPRHTFGTMSSGQQYVDECTQNGVPIPPPINMLAPLGIHPGVRGWKSQGIIPPASRFADPTDLGRFPAELLTYDNSYGICLQLRSSTSETAMSADSGFDGIICLSMRTSKACFWVGYNVGAGEVVPISVADPPSGNHAVGGYQLFTNNETPCTDCHAGENPFIIHPNLHLLLTFPSPSPAETYSPTGSVTGPPMNAPVGSNGTVLPMFAPDRYDPIVAGNWPQNSSSARLASDVPPGMPHLQSDVPEDCSRCHYQHGSGGRLPAMNEPGLFNYCGILENAIARTMPPDEPGRYHYTGVGYYFSQSCGHGSG